MGYPLKWSWARAVVPKDFDITWRDSGVEPFIKLEFRLSGFPHDEIPEPGWSVFSIGNVGYLGTVDNVEWREGELHFNVWYRPFFKGEIPMFLRLHNAESLEIRMLSPEEVKAWPPAGDFVKSEPPKPAFTITLSPEAEAGLAAGAYRWEISPVGEPRLVATVGA